MSVAVMLDVLLAGDGMGSENEAHASAPGILNKTCRSIIFKLKEPI